MRIVGDRSTIYPSEFQLGEWWVRPTLHRLERDGETTQIEPRSMDVLVDLARHAGELRSKRRLLHVVWGDAYVSDDVLTHAIWELRKALGDDPRDPRYIQTTPRKGYRLIASVSRSSGAAGEASTEAPSNGLLEPGVVLGERYEIRSQLGRGGMGEVWQAFDLKLRVEVALKALSKELFRDGHRRDLLLREVRAAREVVSPNVCRVFDLIEVEGRELVSMEYVDGQTLLEVLQQSGPLELKEAQEIASQFLAGLEAIHLAGLVHRDVKPENIMLTRAGRVVVMDFGLARRQDTGAGTVAGTPAYMAPELLARSKVDARADVYSAGVVLAEMVSPDGIQDFDSRQSVWEGVHSEPARLPDSPWAPVIKKAVANERDRRYRTAHTLIRALEDVTLRVEGAENLKPYPGLASFTEDDTDYFFGREAEIEQFWRKLEGPARLLAVVGPSGAGKTSFLRAGLIPSAPADWAVLRCVPGGKALAALRRVMTPELHDDIGALQAWMAEPENADVAVAALAGWRRRHDHSLLIVDQFEELFTLNPAEEQARFATLLGRLPLEADVHVVLAMRDDFAVSCHAFESLRPVFHELTVLDTPSGANLRRALVRPGGKCGYRFEDDALVDEMLVEVEDERGALPTLAFAAACLWDARDRDRGLLTRRAYGEIGGVGGALALHADTTLEKIGAERLPMVREFFRNLVTAQGTRAVREVDALLSIFPEHDRESADQVLQQLIDARLLTCYEVREEGSPPTRRVEIIHESLLANWPRLVRWQTQDTGAAQLRDELRQAARTWQEHERSDDLLWTGTAYREFQLWHERYPGGLTETEGAFGDAMTALADRLRRRRRLAAAAALAVLAMVASILGLMWAKSEQETRRAEASELLALGQLELDSYPSAAVAHSIASLEFADSPGARQLAQAALWRGPTAFVVNDESTWRAKFTPDGQSLVQAGDGTGHLRLIREDGTSELLEHGHELSRLFVRMGLEADVFLSFDVNLHFIELWSAAEARRLGRAEYESPARIRTATVSAAGQRWVSLVSEGDDFSIHVLGFDGTRKRLGNLDYDFAPKTLFSLEPRTGRWLGAASDDDVVIFEIGEDGLSEPRRLGRPKGPVSHALFDPLGRFFATIDTDGHIELWDPRGTSPPTILDGPPGDFWLKITDDGSLLQALGYVEGNISSWVYTLGTDPPRLLRQFDLGLAGSRHSVDSVGWRHIKIGPDLKIRLWPMGAAADAEPVLLLRGEVTMQWDYSIHPDGHWLANADRAGAGLWPLARPYPAVIRGHESLIQDLLFGPDGRWLASCAVDSTVKLWPLEGDVPKPGRILFNEAGAIMNNLARTPDGNHLLVGTNQSGVQLLSLSEEASLPDPDDNGDVYGATIGPNGRLGAGAYDLSSPEIQIRIWDLASGEEVTILRPEGRMVQDLQLTEDGHLLSSSELGLRKWNIETGESESLFEADIKRFSASPDGRQAVIIEGARFESSAPKRAVFLDFETGERTRLETHGARVTAVAFDPKTNMVVTGDTNGVVRVGPTSGDEPHLLIGHEHQINSVAIDPLGRWIASGGTTTVRLWPMPDLSKPPLHTLPRQELIAKLETLTNLRIVRDADSVTGWTLTHDPFPGWETLPTW